ncbi:MAG: hypothetical protein HYZ28_12700 [Myxococcales bacterium]|nr:hypothetical protein [Myxococcales bacterium]
MAGAGAATSLSLLASLLDACGAKAPPPGFVCGAASVACREPGSVEERTFVAIADTIVPGCASDPDGQPGAAEGCVLSLASDPGLPVAGVLPFLVALVDQYSNRSFDKRFIALDLEARTSVLAAAERDSPLLSYAFRFFRTVHYAGLYNDVGPRSLGYPGGNLGYAGDPDFSFRDPIGQELTPEGNLP